MTQPTRFTNVTSDEGYEVNGVSVLNEQGQLRPGVMRVAKVALAPGNANAFSFAWQNPEASAIIVHRVIVDRTTAGGTASSVLDIGTAANATTASDNLIDGLDANATGVADNIDDQGTNGKSRQRLDANGGTTDFITGRILVQNAASLAGNAYIYYTAV